LGRTGHLRETLSGFFEESLSTNSASLIRPKSGGFGHALGAKTITPGGEGMTYRNDRARARRSEAARKIGILSEVRA
jgi:NADH:ubiquinone oxidoreductase subunit F (NADH-binding)